MAWNTIIYKQIAVDGANILHIKVINDAKREAYEVNVDPALTEDEILDALAFGIKVQRDAADAADALIDTSTLEGKINAL